MFLLHRLCLFRKPRLSQLATSFFACTSALRKERCSGTQQHLNSPPMSVWVYHDSMEPFQKLCLIRLYPKPDVLPAFTGTLNKFLAASLVKRNFTSPCPLPSPLPAAARPRNWSHLSCYLDVVYKALSLVMTEFSLHQDSGRVSRL